MQMRAQELMSVFQFAFILYLIWQNNDLKNQVRFLKSSNKIIKDDLPGVIRDLINKVGKS